ncbi:MAG: secretin N-terminal domain-containing protein [Planctomycetota bacterium]
MSRRLFHHRLSMGGFVLGTLIVAWTFTTAPAVSAQEQLVPQRGITGVMREKLAERYSLDLRDATLLDALFAIRDATSLNIVVGNEVTGSVNASFSETPVHDILDSLLTARGYGYRVVGNSLVIVPLESLGDQLPLFETEVIGLGYSTPRDLLTSVESMLSPEGHVHGVDSSNSLVIIDYPDRIARAKAHIEALDRAAKEYEQSRRVRTNPESGFSGAGGADVAEPIVVRIFRPQYVNSVTLADAIAPLLSQSGRAAAVELEDKLVVTDSQEAIDRIALAMAELDVPRPQVRIWALIYDCSIDDLSRLGTNWRSGVNGSGIDAASGDPSQSIVLDTVTSALPTGANGLLTFSSLNSNTSLRSVVQALNTSGDSRLLADPNVFVMNHEAAQIEIVTEVPYQQLTQGLEGGTIGTTEFREAGVTLNVTPHIAQDGTIAMVVNPRFSLLTGFSEPDNAPIIDRRETTTTVRLMDHQTIVLGGLRQRTRIADRSEIPLLGKLPYVGRLFRFRSFSSRESELLVFITPQIVHGHSDMSLRENCMGDFLQREIDGTPTSPVPFGIEALRAEHRARVRAIDLREGDVSCRSCTDGNCQVHGTVLDDANGAPAISEVETTSWIQSRPIEELRPINMGLSIQPELPR